MSLVYVDEDPWLKEYEDCEALCGELAVRVETYRSNGGGGSDAADIRLRLRQCDQQLAQLRSALFSNEPERYISSDEKERRQRCMEALYDKARSIRNQFSTPRLITAAALDANRETLLGGSSSVSTPKGNFVVDQLDPETLRKNQTQALDEQDRGLEALSKIISRQKNIAQSIDTEVTSQTEIVTNLADSMGRVGARTEVATRRTAAIITRDSTCGYWMVIILLFITIILVEVLL